MQATMTKEEIYVVSMLSDQQLVADAWSRGIGYAEYRAYVDAHGRDSFTEEAFKRECEALEYQMAVYFANQ